MEDKDEVIRPSKSKKKNDQNIKNYGVGQSLGLEDNQPKNIKRIDLDQVSTLSYKLSTLYISIYTLRTQRPYNCECMGQFVQNARTNHLNGYI